VNEHLTIKRTTGRHPDFESMIRQLDNELWNEMKEVQATYDQFNKVPDIDTVVLIYRGVDVIACGCFKKYRNDTVEIKRMFTVPAERGKGLAVIVLNELEKWAVELNSRYSILETGKKLLSAVQLYKKSGYTITENYDQYIGLEQSVCMKKELIADKGSDENIS
jgi:putative acetyltransferase